MKETYDAISAHTIFRQQLLWTCDANPTRLYWWITNTAIVQYLEYGSPLFATTLTDAAFFDDAFWYVTLHVLDVFRVLQLQLILSKWMEYRGTGL